MHGAIMLSGDCAEALERAGLELIAVTDDVIEARIGTLCEEWVAVDSALATDPRHDYIALQDGRVFVRLGVVKRMGCVG